MGSSPDSSLYIKRLFYKGSLAGSLAVPGWGLRVRREGTFSKRLPGQEPRGSQGKLGPGW